MKKKTFHISHSRGYYSHGWLDTSHTFSFAEYFNPERTHFGALRVLNDDTVAPSMGFDPHPHNDMEIISIPLYGELQHKDNSGHSQIIGKGDVQVMSAGTGIVHSEFNGSGEKPVNFLQIWLFPDEKGHAPRYDQRHYEFELHRGSFVKIVSPWETVDEEVLKIHQDAYLYIGYFNNGHYPHKVRQTATHGVYLFIIQGTVEVDGQRLHARDGLQLEGYADLDLHVMEPAKILLLEVPMIE